VIIVVAPATSRKDGHRADANEVVFANASTLLSRRFLQARLNPFVPYYLARLHRSAVRERERERESSNAREALARASQPMNSRSLR